MKFSITIPQNDLVVFGGSDEETVPPHNPQTYIASSISSISNCLILDHSTFPENGARIASYITYGTARMISDGLLQTIIGPITGIRDLDPGLRGHMGHLHWKYSGSIA